MTKRKSLLILPLLALPFLCFMFYSLGGGRGGGVEQPAAGLGFNPELPGARWDKQKQAKDKLEYYKQADQDSMRRKEYLRRDPYVPKTVDTMVAHRKREQAEDARADELLRRLDKLKQSIQVAPVAGVNPAMTQGPEIHPRPPLYSRHAVMSSVRDNDAPEEDPQLEKLNGMLDKIIRIQHPAEGAVSAEHPEGPAAVPDTVAANSLPAVIQEDQVLVSGATISLRLTEEVTINGVRFPRDQLVYGVVAFNNDRMLINIQFIRREQSLYGAALQVYDLDGLPGIHMPGSLGRETVKQSADQGISSMGIMGLEASPMAQVTNAGVLAAKTLLSRKVRLVRVTVRAGYQVLLRNTNARGKILVAHKQDAVDSMVCAPEAVSFIPFIHRGVRHGKMELELRGIYLRDSLMWMLFRLENHSPIGYVPGYIRWCIRDRKRGRRTAYQEVVVKPVYVSPAAMVAGDSSRVLLAGFKPFALPGDKELVLQLAEGNGARELVMEISGKEILKARRYEQE